MIQHTEQTTNQIYDDSLAIRKKVFMEEQKVPLELEIEDEDQCIHFVLYTESGQPAATCRLFKKRNNQVKLQRMAVLKPFRQKGLGKEIMLAAETYAIDHHYDWIYLDAQTHALGFYQQLGYEAFGDEFLDADIPHFSMKKKLN